MWHAAHQHQHPRPRNDSVIVAPLSSSSSWKKPPSRSRRISNPILSSNTEFIPQPTHHDVLLGRGGHNNKFVGNERLRELALEYVPTYVQSNKNQKTQIAKQLVARITSLQPPGRFMKQLDEGLWVDIGPDLARDKASQVLRDAVRDVYGCDVTQYPNAWHPSQDDDDDDDDDVPSSGRSPTNTNREVPHVHVRPNKLRKMEQMVVVLRDDAAKPSMPLGSHFSTSTGSSTSTSNHLNTLHPTNETGDLHQVHVSKSHTAPIAPSPIGSSDPSMEGLSSNATSSSSSLSFSTSIQQQPKESNGIFENHPWQVTTQARINMLQRRLEHIRQRYLQEITSEIQSYQKYGIIVPRSTVHSVLPPNDFVLQPYLNGPNHRNIYHHVQVQWDSSSHTHHPHGQPLSTNHPATPPVTQQLLPSLLQQHPHPQINTTLISNPSESAQNRNSYTHSNAVPITEQNDSKSILSKAMSPTETTDFIVQSFHLDSEILECRDKNASVGGSASPASKNDDDSRLKLLCFTIDSVEKQT